MATTTSIPSVRGCSVDTLQVLDDCAGQIGAAAPGTATARLPLKMQFRHRTRGRLAVEVVGDLDMATASSLVDFADIAAAVTPRTVELDTTGIRFIDAAGHRALAAFQESLTRRGMRVVHHAEGSAVTRLQELLNGLPSTR